MPRASWSTVESCSKQRATRITVLPSCKPSRLRSSYRDRLEYFRLDFAWSQIHGDPQTTRDLILPLCNELTDVVSEKLRRGTDITSLRARQLAVIAWTSAIGLMSALSVTAAAGTGFVHPTNTLLAVINGALEASARDVEPVCRVRRPPVPWAFWEAAYRSGRVKCLPQYRASAARAAARARSLRNACPHFIEAPVAEIFRAAGRIARPQSVPEGTQIGTRPM